MKLSRLNKNLFPTLILEVISGSALIYLVLTHYHGLKIFYGTVLIVTALAGYVVYLMFQKRKLRKESKRLKGKQE